jgi:hypothetical protein
MTGQEKCDFLIQVTTWAGLKYILNLKSEVENRRKKWLESH